MEGFTHHKTPPISLQVIKTHLEIDHVNKPSFFKHLFAIAIELTDREYVYEIEAIQYLSQEISTYRKCILIDKNDTVF